jgi:hypothetical protein
MKNNISKYFDEGQIVKVFWKDTTVVDRIPANKINDDLLYIEDTISIGMLVKWDKDTIMIASEYCFDLSADACSIETIPMGMITVIEGFERTILIKVDKEFIFKNVNSKGRRIVKHRKKHYKRKKKRSE